jgi:hypothetical protein
MSIGDKTISPFCLARVAFRSFFCCGTFHAKTGIHRFEKERSFYALDIWFDFSPLTE